MNKIVFNKKDSSGNVTATYEPKVAEVVNLNGGVIKFWRGSRSDYLNLTEVDSDTVYLIEDD